MRSVTVGRPVNPYLSPMDTFGQPLRMPLPSWRTNACHPYVLAENGRVFKVLTGRAGGRITFELGQVRRTRRIVLPKRLKRSQGHRWNIACVIVGQTRSDKRETSGLRIGFAALPSRESGSRDSFWVSSLGPVIIHYANFCTPSSVSNGGAVCHVQHSQ